MTLMTEFDKRQKTKADEISGGVMEIMYFCSHEHIGEILHCNTLLINNIH